MVQRSLKYFTGLQRYFKGFEEASHDSMSFRYCRSSASHPSASSAARRVRRYRSKSDKTDAVAVTESVSPVVVVGVVVGDACGRFFQYFSIYNPSVIRI